MDNKKSGTDPVEVQLEGCHLRRSFTWSFFCVLVFTGILAARPASAKAETSTKPNHNFLTGSETHLKPYLEDTQSVLSPYWGTDIQQWDETIAVVSELYGFHPDFIAAVIQQEMGIDDQTGKALGAFGLVGITPRRTDEALSPSSESVINQINQFRWGMAVLSYVVKESGGDLSTALAVYKGGWDQIDEPYGRDYAASVLDNYARAIATRSGVSPDLAGRWTIAVEILAGNVPAESLLLLGPQPNVGWRTYSDQIVYAFSDSEGRAYFVRAYAVPLGLSEYIAESSGDADFNTLEAPLRARLGDKSAREAPGNPRILMACIPRLSRLRGQVTTRWYSPSHCPVDGR